MSGLFASRHSGNHSVFGRSNTPILFSSLLFPNQPGARPISVTTACTSRPVLRQDYRRCHADAPIQFPATHCRPRSRTADSYAMPSYGPAWRGWEARSARISPSMALGSIGRDRPILNRASSPPQPSSQKYNSNRAQQNRSRYPTGPAFLAFGGGDDLFASETGLEVAWFGHRFLSSDRPRRP